MQHVCVCCRFVLLFMPEMKAGRLQHNLYMMSVWVIGTFSNITVVYYTRGSRYRHTFWALLGRKTTKSESHDSSGTVTALASIS